MSTCLWMTMHRWTALLFLNKYHRQPAWFFLFTRGTAAELPQDDSLPRLQKHGPSLLSPFS